MELNKKDAFALYVQYTKDLPSTKSKKEKADVAALKLIQDHLPSGNFAAIQQSFFRLIENKQRSGSAKHVVEHWETSKFIAASLPLPPDDEKPKRGRPTVNLRDQPCKKKKHLLLKEMVEAVEKFSQEQNISKEEALTLTVDECHRIWRGKDNPPWKTIPTVEATALIYNVNLSTSQYQMIRTACLKHDVVFPVRNDIDKCKSLYHPPISSCQLDMALLRQL